VAPSIATGSPAAPPAVCEGVNTDLFVTASGTSLTYDWQKLVSGTYTDVSTSDPVVQDQGHDTLVFKNPSNSNSGNYRVIVSSTVCPTPVTSGPVGITVNLNPTAPTFTYLASGPLVPPFCMNDSNLNFALTSVSGVDSVVKYGWVADSFLNASLRFTGDSVGVISTSDGTGGSAIIEALVTFPSTGCTAFANDTLSVSTSSSAASDTGRVIYDGTSYICLNNTKGITYQWGYDDSMFVPHLFGTGDAHWLGAQNIILTASGTQDTTGAKVWCVTGLNGCYTKNYYIDPAPGPVPVVDTSIGSPVRIFPNPVLSQAVVQWQFNSLNDKVELLVVDMLGRKVMTIVPGSSSPGLATIDLSSLPDGLYMVAVFQNNKITAVGKLVKIRQ
jgi:hypothetical protein